MAKISPRAMELHMGILQNRMKELKGKMTVCMAKMEMDAKTRKDNGFDKKEEKQKFNEFDKQYLKIEAELKAYENKVLAATNF